MISVLVLDDREADRSLLSTVLGYAGYEVTEADSGEAALELAAERRPDLIISDILMPGMNGYEFVRRLREHPAIAHTLVIFATANYVEGEVRRLADSCGVHHFLEKPADPQQVIATVAGALGAEETPPEPVDQGDFDREQLHVLNDKLVEKVAELERVSAQRQGLIVELLNAQEDERRRIAQAIHDDPIQTVSAVSMRLDTLAERLPEGEAESLRALRSDAARAVEDLRSLVFELEPVGLRNQGLRVALESYMDGARAEGLDCRLELEGEGPSDEATLVLVYRMAREALANARKHSGAGSVTIAISRRRGDWVVDVSDDGDGFDAAAAERPRPGHLGLAAMRERLDTAGGSLSVESAPGEGSTVTIKVPELAGEG